MDSLKDNLVSKKNSLIFILLGSLFLAFHLFYMNPESDEVIESKKGNLITSTIIDQKNSSLNDEIKTEKAAIVTESIAVQEKFEEKLNEMKVCLQIDLDYDQIAKPQFDSFYKIIYPSFGAATGAVEEWSNTHLKTPEGEERRIRIELDSTSEENTIKKLSLYSLDSEKLPEKMPLDESYEKNPSEEKIKELESLGKITFKQIAMNHFFAAGESVYHTEINGSIDEIEITNKHGQIFKCHKLNTENPSCRCL